MLEIRFYGNPVLTIDTAARFDHNRESD